MRPSSCWMVICVHQPWKLLAHVSIFMKQIFSKVTVELKDLFTGQAGTCSESLVPLKVLWKKLISWRNSECDQTEDMTRGYSTPLIDSLGGMGEQWQRREVCQSGLSLCQWRSQ
jgi:hypothetical protein